MKEKLLLLYSFIVLAMAIGIGVCTPTADVSQQPREEVLVSWWSLLYPVESYVQETEEPEVRFWLWEQLCECFA